MSQHSLPPALTDKELEDALGTAVCKNSEPITISGKCHTGAPMLVVFDVTNSSLLLVCPTCQQLVTRIAVAKSSVH